MKRLYITASVLGALVACSYINGKGDSEKSAHQWAEQNLPGAEETHVACMGRDTDNNGYNSCTITVRWPDEQRVEVIPIECSVNRAGNGCGNEGCRALATFGVRGGRR